MRNLPSGTVTFLFTDVEGSTSLLNNLGDEYAEVLAEHRRILRSAFAKRGGVEVDTQGDAFFYAFARASDAVAAAEAGRRALGGGPIRVRIGLHTGEPVVTDEGYVGMDVHKGARIAAAGHGGQVLLSEATARLVDAPLRDLGDHRLKDLTAPLRLYQLGEGEFPPPRTLYGTNLPVQATPLVGRERELAEVGELVRGHRLLTLTGPGGSGKTRLALQLAAEAVEEFPDGVFWVPLQAVRDPDLVEPTIAQTLGAKDGLAAHVGDKRMLLLLDNFEHLVAAASTVAELLTRTSNLKLLVTSREPLRLAGEQRYAVDPLLIVDAVALFVERARAVEPGFAPTDAVVATCRRLDCLPLAIELAAARVSALSPDQIFRRLRKALPLLALGRRDAHVRQRTLAATIEWSYDLLSSLEKGLFRRLAVFARTFDLEAAEVVCDADLDTLQALVDKSLVRREGDRYAMLETVREYGVELLEARREAEELRRRHAMHFVEAVATGDRDLLDAVVGVDVFYRRLEEERDNLRAALAWLRETDELELELRLAGSMEVFWSLAHVGEGRTWLDGAFAREGVVSPRVRVRALFAAAHVAQDAGDYTRQRACLVDALASARLLGDSRLVAAALASLSGHAILHGDLDRAEELLQEAERAAGQAADERRLDGIATLKANVALYRGDLERARHLFELALARFEEHRNIGGVGITLSALGMIAYYQARGDDAVELLKRSLRLYREVALTSVGDALEVLGALLGQRGRARIGATLVGAADAWRREAGRAQQPFERDLGTEIRATLRARLGDDAFASALTEGAGLDIEGAIDLALHALD